MLWCDTKHVCKQTILNGLLVRVLYHCMHACLALQLPVTHHPFCLTHEEAALSGMDCAGKCATQLEMVVTKSLHKMKQVSKRMVL